MHAVQSALLVMAGTKRFDSHPGKLPRPFGCTTCERGMNAGPPGGREALAVRRSVSYTHLRAHET